MRGLVIATHGKLSLGLMDAVAVISGDYKNAVTISLGKNDHCLEFNKKIEEAIEKVDEGDGVVIFTDILGGTPSNQSTILAHKHNIYCVTGVNLPMLIEFTLSADTDISLSELVERCVHSATEAIRITNRIKED